MSTMQFLNRKITSNVRRDTRVSLATAQTLTNVKNGIKLLRALSMIAFIQS